MVLELDLLSNAFAVCRFPPGTRFDDVAPTEGMLCFVRAEAEVSIVVPDLAVQDGWTASRGWRCLRVCGPLDLTLTGVLASLLGPLAEAGVSVFPFASYDTDWVLVPGADLVTAARALTAAGHVVHS